MTGGGDSGEVVSLLVGGSSGGGGGGSNSNHVTQDITTPNTTHVPLITYTVTSVDETTPLQENSQNIYDNDNNDDYDAHPTDVIETLKDCSHELDVIDFVLVFNKDNKNKEARNKYLSNLMVNGLELQIKTHDEQKLVFLLVKIPFEKCLEIAEKVKFKMPIEINDLEKDNFEGFVFNSVWHRFKSLVPDEVNMDKKRKYFTAPYSANLRKKFEKFFDKTNEKKTISPKDRCLLAYEILSRTSYSRYLTKPAIFSGNENDRQIGIQRLIAEDIFSAAYPLHEPYGVDEHSHPTNRQLLWKFWARPKNWFTYQPIHIVRQYFGEKLAFYFSWLGFYTTWLVLPSIVGFFVFIYGAITVIWDKPTNEICDGSGIGNTSMCPLCDNSMTCTNWRLVESCFYSKITYLVDNPLTVFFSVFMAVWTVLFVEFWKREQSKLQFEWDAIDFEKKSETIRPQFELKVPDRRTNPITGTEEPYVPFTKRVIRYLFSVSVVLFMIFLVLALVVGVIVYRVSVMMAFPRKEDQAIVSLMTSISAACINLVIIIILSRIYSWIAVKLTDMEYHKTDSKYENALTIKMYLFQFVNFYASIFYIAFFKGRKYRFFDSPYFREFKEQCNQSGCLSELCIQLAIIMVGKQILNNIQEVLYPILQNNFTRMWWGRRKNKDYKSNRWNDDYHLMGWTNLTLFDEYLEMVIQYGFVVLFVVAFPLGPLFAFLNNILEIRIDAFKVLTQLKRPIPKKAQDIGIWLPILNTISKLGVITNGLIIAFTSEFIPRLVYRFTEYEERGRVGNLYGYVNFTLSKNITIVNNQPVICYYRDFREPYDSPDKFEYTKTYYYVLAARLAFLVLFEHVVFSMVTLMHWIPDVPKVIQDQIERENFITQRALWEITPELRSPSSYACNALLNVDTSGNKSRSQSFNDIKEIDDEIVS